MDKIRSFRPPYVRVKTFVLLPIIDVKARIVVFCTPATGTPKPTSLQEFLNRMMDIGVIIPIELAKWERSKVSLTKKPAKSWFSLAKRQIMGRVSKNGH